MQKHTKIKDLFPFYIG